MYLVLPPPATGVAGAYPHALASDGAKYAPAPKLPASDATRSSKPCSAMMRLTSALVP